MWGDALYLWALTELDAFLEERRFMPLAEAYCARFAESGPRVDQSDTCAPGLVAWAVLRSGRLPAAAGLVDRTLAYARGEPRLSGDIPNHLGHSPEGRLYPRSVWVDSLMMFGLLAARCGRGLGDEALTAMAARLPGQFSALLQDASTGLFRHAWLAGRREAYPAGPIFWGRGNGWVVASLPMILSELGAEGPDGEATLRVLRRISAALLGLQRPDGYWDTLLGSPGRNYRESSATALIAAGFMRSARSGWLGPEYGEAGKRAFEALADGLGKPGEEPSMREVSAPTIPLPIFPRAGYAFVPLRADLPYGLSALFLAAIEYEKLGAGSGAAPR